MTPLHSPSLLLAVLLPAIGALFVRRLSDPDRARRHSLVWSGMALALTVVAWRDFVSLHEFAAPDPWLPGARSPWLEVDELNAPLLPLAALLSFLTQLATLRTKIQRFSFGAALFAESILLATLGCPRPWGIVALLILGVVPPWLELRRRRERTRFFLIHMGLFAVLLVVGQALMDAQGDRSDPSPVATLLLTFAVLLRCGIVPVHCWMTDLFERATFGTAMLFVTPMVGAYGAMRLVLPTAPGWVLSTIAIVSLVTAVYASGMALVQRDTRRFYCYLFLSHSSLVLVGLEIATPVGLTGALCVWLSVGLALTGFGLTLRSVEARTGRLSLFEFHGLYEHLPALAGFFLLTGLASIGFPGTIGFIGAELLVDGAVQDSPLVGAVVVIAAALNGLAVLQAYFRIFTGTRHGGTIDIRSRLPERAAILMLSGLILGGGLYPQPGVASRYHAAQAIVQQRRERFPDEGTGSHESDEGHGDHDAGESPSEGEADTGVGTAHSAGRSEREVADRE